MGILSKAVATGFNHRQKKHWGGTTKLSAEEAAACVAAVVQATPVSKALIGGKTAQLYVGAPSGGAVPVWFQGSDKPKPTWVAHVTIRPLTDGTGSEIAAALESWTERDGLILAGDHFSKFRTNLQAAISSKDPSFSVG